ncbi:MAG: hypothetical protein L3J63_10805, partial [Geopsychrobacter sp.]|nr:hypothetical protein [Geopsychrobacter sp.]
AVASLHAADLVLTPVREAAGLAALSQIRRELKIGGGNDQMLWLIPALLEPVTSLEFLRFAAQERGCQVLNDIFCQDERLSQRTKGQGGTVLTRMPQGPVHRLLVQMAQLVLNRYKDGPDTACRLQRLRQDKILPSSARRIELICPLCQRLAHAQAAHYCESLPQRNRWLVHAACMADLLWATAAGPFWQTGQVAILRTGVEGVGLVPQLRLLVAEDDGLLLESLLLDPAPGSGWQNLLRHATNRTLAEQQPALVFVYPAVSGIRVLSSKWRSCCAGLRKRLRSRLAPEL